MIVIPFDVGHLLLLDPHDEQRAEYEFTLPRASGLAQSPWRYTGIVDNRAVACGGVQIIRENTGLAWMCFAKGSGKYMKEITNATREALDACPLPRIETLVKTSFKAGHRWMKRLGFELEAPAMRKYGPNGETYSLYARIK